MGCHSYRVWNCGRKEDSNSQNPNAEVSSYYTDYIGIWIPDAKSRNGVYVDNVPPDLLTAMEVEGWNVLYHEYRSDEKYILNRNQIIGWTK